MSCWIFKVSKQELYADQMGKVYIFDNTHSVQVQSNDSFLYLDKRQGAYAFVGHGLVERLVGRDPSLQEQRNTRVRKVFKAHLSGYVKYQRPLDIRKASHAGRQNRLSLGIVDVNRLGWSVSIARVDPSLFEAVLHLAYLSEIAVAEALGPDDFSIPDAWAIVRKRKPLEAFHKEVCRRQGYICAVCGTGVKSLLEVAHLKPYASGIEHRANPANGVCLCAYCHKAFDAGLFAFRHDGSLLISKDAPVDRVFKFHLNGLPAETRASLLLEVGGDFLDERLALLEDV